MLPPDASGPPPAPRDFGAFGFADPTPRFLRITAAEQADGRTRLDGVVVIPGLPVFRVRLRTDAAWPEAGQPGRTVLEDTVRTALHEDVMVELSWN